MRIHSLAAAVGILSVSSLATAQSNVYGFIADQSTTFNPLLGTHGQFDVTFPGSIQRSIDYNRPQPAPDVPSLTARATAGAGAGFVRSSTYASIVQNVSLGGPGVDFLRSLGVATAHWSDVVLTGPAGSTGMQPLSMNFSVDGGINGLFSTATNPGDVSYGAFCNVIFQINVNGSFAVGGALTVSNQRSGPLSVALATGVFANFNVTGGAFSGATASVMVPINTPFAVEMILSTETRVDMPGGGSGVFALNCDFSDTGMISTSGPAFNVPAGFTVNSGEANVTNNAFTFVPAPGSAAALCMLGVLAVRRRRI
ncbi:hypothetical protein BH11PLA1_BH11PLA1_16340 [soil metagenome]